MILEAAVEKIQDAAVLPQLSNTEFEQFRSLIHRETGIHLKEIKRDMLASRLTRRLRALQLPTFSQYLQLLTASADRTEELGKMINAVTTNLTAFYREEHHFTHLGRRLTESAVSGQRRYRIWCAAASTGEEPYTIAMTVLKSIGAICRGLDALILASDIDTDVLKTASAGVYRAEDLRKVPKEDQQRFFSRGTGTQDGFLRAKPELRQMIRFRQFNLNQDQWPMKGPFDAVFCRNVLIYFDEATQRRLVGRLVNLLAPGGLLYLGHSETLHWLRETVTPVGHAIYRRKV